MSVYKISQGSIVSVSNKSTWTTIRLEKDLILNSNNVANTLPESHETVFSYKKNIYFIKNKDIELL